jgi:hypothetical protein
MPVKKNTDVSIPSTAVKSARSVLDPALLSDATTIEEVAALLAQSGMTLAKVADYGDGFASADKATLVNVPFLIIDWVFGTSDKFYTDGQPSEYVVVRAITADRRKIIFSAGGTNGICQSLQQIAATRVAAGEMYPQSALLAANGLRASNYFVDPQSGDIVDTPTPGYSLATTYYLADM